MRYICMYCSKEWGSGDKSQPPSHGVCSECKTEQIKLARIEYEKRMKEKTG